MGEGTNSLPVTADYVACALRLAPGAIVRHCGMWEAMQARASLAHCCLAGSRLPGSRGCGLMESCVYHVHVAVGWTGG